MDNSKSRIKKKISDTPDVLYIPPVPEEFRIPKVPEIPKVPDTPDELYIPPVPEVFRIPEAPEMSEVSQISQVPEVLNDCEDAKESLDYARLFEYDNSVKLLSDKTTAPRESHRPTELSDNHKTSEELNRYLRNGFLLQVSKNFKYYADCYETILDEIIEENKTIDNRKDHISNEFDEATAEYDKIIANNVNAYNEILTILSEANISAEEYRFTDKSDYTPPSQIRSLVEKWKKSNFFTRHSLLEKTKIASIGISSLNYINQTIEEKNVAKELLAENKKLKLEELESEQEAFIERKQKARENIVYDFTRYLKSPELQGINNDWEMYSEKLGVSVLAPYTADKSDKTELKVCIGYHVYRVHMPQKLIEVIYSAYDVLDFIKEDNGDITFKVPVFYSPEDDINKYHIKLPLNMASVVQKGIQSYLLRLLLHSSLNEMDFLFIDPVSNGKSFCDLISLIHDDGYGIANTIFCEKSEISQVLSELSNKIKQINQTIKGYSSIYEYNNRHPHDVIKSTVMVAYNFCDEYYRDDQLIPVFENADKCGITIITVAPFSGVFSFERVERVINAYPNKQFVLGSGGTVKELQNGEKSLFDFEFTGAQSNSIQWIDSYNAILKKGVMVCNEYSDIKNKMSDFFSLNSTNGLHIPFAVDKKNQIVDFNLAVDMCYHAFVSGTTGIGKSVLLHSIIANIIRGYHPNDVELWLVDYKAVEFVEYINNKPPHIKFVGLDRSKEFTKSYLHKIHEVILERKKLIMDSGFQKIEEYKSHFGKNSIPRTVLIIDEAHVLSQHLYEDEDLKQFFENMLSEERSFGLSIILSDQAFKNSMKGITDKGKAQIGVRVAMQNTPDEIRDILEVDNSYYQDQTLRNNINTLSIGEAIHRWYEKTDDGSAKLHLDKVKAIHTDRNGDRKEIINSANALVKGTDFREKKSYFVLGSERMSIFNTANPFDYMEKLSSVPKEFEMILGTPSSLEPFHKIVMTKRKGKNLLFVCANEDMQLSVSLYTALNFSKLFNSKIFIMAAEERLSDEFKDYFNSIFGNNLKIAETAEEYDNSLNQIQNCESCIVVWFGIDEILDNMELLGEQKNYAGGSDKNALYDIFGNPKISSGIGTTRLFNRTSEILELLDKGSAYGKFSLVIAESMREILIRRDISTDFFIHKMAFGISTDDSYNLFKKTKTIDVEGELKESTVIYSDGVSYNILRPFKIEEKLKTYFKDETE